MEIFPNTSYLKPRAKLTLDECVTALAWTQHGEVVVGGTAAGTLFWIDGSTHQCVHQVKAHASPIQRIVAGASAGQVFSAGQDGFLKLWENQATSPIFEKKLGKEWVSELTWSSDGSCLGVACGKQVFILDRNGTQLREPTMLESSISSLDWFHGHKALLAGCYGGLNILGIQDPAVLKTYEWKGAFWCAAWSQDGKWIAGATQEKAVHLWEAETAEHLHMPGYPIKVKLMDFTVDSQWLVTTAGNDVSLWDCSGQGPCGTRPKLLREHEELIQVCALQHETNLCATADEAGLLLVWDANCAEEKMLISEFKHSAAFSVAAWSNDDRTLALGSADGLLYIF